MYHSSKIRVKPSVKMADLIDGNPNLLLMLQHFNIDFRVSDQTVLQLYDRYDISENLFVNIANLYNGFSSKGYQLYTEKELIQVIDFLKNTHDYYRSSRTGGKIAGEIFQRLLRGGPRAPRLRGQRGFSLLPHALAKRGKEGGARAILLQEVQRPSHRYRIKAKGFKEPVAQVCPD